MLKSVEEMITYIIDILKTFIIVINYLVLFRQEIYNRKELDNYLANEKNSVLLRQKIAVVGCIGMKFAQWISQRIDIVGYNTVRCLSVFQKLAPAHSFEKTIEEIEAGINIDYNKVFDSIDLEVLGSGSISQVHCCKLKNDIRDMIVKVMHPDVKDNIINKSAHFKRICNGLSWLDPASRALNLNAMYDTILQQTDYLLEAKNQNIMREILAPLNFVKVPTVYIINDNFIVQERCFGYSRQELEEKYPEYLIDMAEKTVIVYQWMIYKGYIHPDLHDGNTLYYVDEDDDNNNKLIVLDYGLVFELADKGFNTMFFGSLEAFANKDNEKILQVTRNAVDRSYYTDEEFEKILIKITTIDLFEKNIMNTSIEDMSNHILKLTREVGIILKTAELYSFLGFIHISRFFKDKDGNQYEVIIGACHRMSTHPNPEVNAVGKYLDSLAMKYRDQN